MTPTPRDHTTEDMLGLVDNLVWYGYLSAAGIAERDLQTAGIQIQPRYNYTNKPDGSQEAELVGAERTGAGEGPRVGGGDFLGLVGDHEEARAVERHVHLAAGFAQLARGGRLTPDDARWGIVLLGTQVTAMQIGSLGALCRALGVSQRYGQQ